jgi:hypothetical protein
METQQAQAGATPHGTESITVTVNNREVSFNERQVTGAQLKAIAISQGVQIQPDFLLFEILGHGHQKPIDDAEIVHLHPHQDFRAVAPDDNS